MVAVDTNVLIRLIVRDDSKQTAAAEAFTKEGAWTPLVVIAEAVWVLRSVYNLGAAAIASAIEMLLDNKTLSIQDSGAVAIALELYRSRPTLGFSDCLILAMARRTGHLPLGTFDRALGRCEGAQKL